MTALRSPHTPGPWIVNPFSARVDCAALDEWGDPLPICELLWPTDYRSEDETQANARLIAAAPELLEALTRTLDALEKLDAGETKVAKAARAAIAKATGAP